MAHCSKGGAKASKSSGYNGLRLSQDGHRRAHHPLTVNFSGKRQGKFLQAGFKLGWEMEIVQFHEQKHPKRTVGFSSGVAKRLAGEDKGSQKPAFIIRNGMGGSPPGAVFEPCLPVTCCTDPIGLADGHGADH